MASLNGTMQNTMTGDRPGAQMQPWPMAPTQEEQDLAAALKELHDHLEQAQGQANTAQSKWQSAVNEAPPTVDANHEFFTKLSGAIGDSLGGNNRSSENASNTLDQEKAQLIQQRVQRLKVMEDAYHEAADRATKLGNVELQLKYLNLAEKASTARQEAFDSIKAQHKTQADLEEARIHAKAATEAAKIAGQSREDVAVTGAGSRVDAARIAAEARTTSAQVRADGLTRDANIAANSRTDVANIHAKTQLALGAQKDANQAARESATDDEGKMLPGSYRKQLIATEKLAPASSKTPEGRQSYIEALRELASNPLSKESAQSYMQRVLRMRHPYGGTKKQSSWFSSRYEPNLFNKDEAAELALQFFPREEVLNAVAKISGGGADTTATADSLGRR